MKKLVLILVLVSMALGTGCAKKKKDEGKLVQRGQSRVTTTTQGYDVRYQNSQWGEIFSEAQYQDDFQDMVRYLVSASFDPYQIGFVSAERGQNTGVRFIGKVKLQKCNTTTSAIVAGSSSIKILIFDEYVGQQDSTGKQIEAYPIQFSSASTGNLQNGVLTVTFKDTYGEVTIRGNMSSQYFQGEVYFRNFKSYDGSQGQVGQEAFLGYAEVLTSGFISCK